MRRLLWSSLTVICLTASGLVAQTPGATRVSSAGGLLQPGDLIRLKIWREPDLSGEFTVSETGEAVLPKIGTVNVLGISADSLGVSLRRSYETYLRNPTIEVTVLRRINILGAVNKPGLYPVDATMTVADALALAGGATSEGRLDRVHLIRNGQRVEIKLSPESRVADTPLVSGDQLMVPLRSWLARNASWVISGGAAMAGVIVALTAR